MRLAVIRGICALACALTFHALLVAGTVFLGWLAPDGATIPELDLTSVELSFSETPVETAAPIEMPPVAPAKEPPPPPPPPESRLSEPPPLNLPPDPRTPVVPRPTEPRPTDLRPPAPGPPEPDPKPQPSVVAAPAAPAPSQARVAVDKPPAPYRRIKPEYPKGARQRGEEGAVTLELDVSSDGTVDGVRIVDSCGFAELEQAAVQAVKRARFSPARRGTAAVPATARLTLTFRLKD